ncbi:carotenoid biosynthesis protein [Bifidobacterium sp. ESL0732]|uniref:carotenoid biosynthesis protein n=1 Tax=Bifidobacterium sp. ESL0732 TaxID=2983222 RepID=UPI0023F99865|nr:carotenoid biosynthesis protein [Bifidobacterium sp. ESL0732]WEV63980.1 carotenoid biosynthesis protein [Bifidobacterium sp. ESL0732]
MSAFFDKDSDTTITSMPDEQQRSLRNRLLVFVALVVVGTAIAGGLAIAKVIPIGYAVLVGVTTITLMLWSHASTLIGTKSATMMFITGIVMGFVFEDFSVHFNVGGGYYFQPILGPKIDVIPLVIPQFWVISIYMCWVMMNFILDGAPTPRINTPFRILERALAADLIMTTVDLSADPVAVHIIGAWVWKKPGTYFGVPYANYTFIWFLVGVLTLVVHGFQERKEVKTWIDTAHYGLRIWTILPVLAYGGNWLMMMLINYDGAIGLLAGFSMGGPFVIALVKWIDWYRATSPKALAKKAVAEKANA